MKPEKIRVLATFYSLPKKQQKAVMLLFTGVYKQSEIAEQLQVAEPTFYGWKTHEQFRVAQDEYNKFMLSDLTSEAIVTMRKLLKARSEMVRFSAAKDILDRSMNDAQIRKAEAEADIAEAKAKQISNTDETVRIVFNDNLTPDREDIQGNENQS
ncbi:phBC6A51 family helix-turn-helix protein [Lactiplantibacillus plantarum]|uniref:phBC6A51 family helix-turn-helix protein n=1 Tax=Lactiplantibacillus plantarum TaxID=1590 RepID=UPI0018AD334B|nr:phBC6A51 family helix-turn-helix protein [Lactiplantibacillus plantarum]WGF86008.1 phBC6A51 family helix-turn-helix protein [Lactiplantibacillus plantarum]WGG43333.1 phBC6A51 family helix-turn-helix protein [Lactiplantibacillus plantarum]